jgi:hypothetical protein
VGAEVQLTVEIWIGVAFIAIAVLILIVVAYFIGLDAGRRGR